VRAQVEQLLEAALTTLGYAFTVLTAGWLLHHVREQLGLAMHKNTLRHLLDALGFVYRRPKHDLTALQDSEAKAEAKTLFDDLKKAQAGEIELFFMDETTIGLLCYLVRCWMRKGQQKRLATPGQQQWLHCFGAYNWRTDEVVAMPAKQKNAEAFCDFLEVLLTFLPSDRPTVFVLDNASIHHSQMSQAMLAYLEDRFLVYWLPKYCSDLNPIERFWRHLKALACADHFFATIPQLLASVQLTLDNQTHLTHPDRLTFSKS